MHAGSQDVTASLADHNPLVRQGLLRQREHWRLFFPFGSGDDISSRD